jgi:hypothetical protein
MKQEIIGGLKFWLPIVLAIMIIGGETLPIYEFVTFGFIAIIIFWFSSLATELKINDVSVDFDIKTGEWVAIRREI